MSVLEITFFVCSKYLLPGIRTSSKTYIPGSKSWWLKHIPFAARLGSCHIHDQTKFHEVKGIDNAFDLMELCLVLQAKAVFYWTLVSNSKKLTFTTEIQDSNFLLSAFLSGGKWDFQVAYGTYTVNFEPWMLWMDDYYCIYSAIRQGLLSLEWLQLTKLVLCNFAILQVDPSGSRSLGLFWKKNLCLITEEIWWMIWVTTVCLNS